MNAPNRLCTITMSTKLICFTAALLLAAAMPMLAHHAFSAEYDRNQPVKVTGTVSTLETVPVTFTGWLRSYSAENAWCASIGIAAASKRAAVKQINFVLIVIVHSLFGAFIFLSFR